MGCLQSNYSNSNNETLVTTLDKFIPLHEVKSRVSCSTPWFDNECRSTKRRVRLLERRYRRTRMDQDKLAWITGLRDKHRFFKEKESLYWENIVSSNASDSKKLWRSVSTMLGKPVKQQSSLPINQSINQSVYFETRRLIKNHASARGETRH